MKKSVLSKFFNRLSNIFLRIQKLGSDTRKRMAMPAAKSNNEE